MYDTNLSNFFSIFGWKKLNIFHEVWWWVECVRDVSSTRTLYPPPFPFPSPSSPALHQTAITMAHIIVRYFDLGKNNGASHPLLYSVINRSYDYLL